MARLYQVSRFGTVIGIGSVVLVVQLKGGQYEKP
jgi:hypothetical protein